MAEAKYECHNEACPLGSREDRGQFTGGLSEASRSVLGLPPDNPVGEGICPNCGVKGKKVGTYEPAQGDDPYEELHASIAERVADPEDELGPEDAQAAFEELVAAAEEGEE